MKKKINSEMSKVKCDTTALKFSCLMVLSLPFCSLAKEAITFDSAIYPSNGYLWKLGHEMIENPINKRWRECHHERDKKSHFCSLYSYETF